MMFLPVTADSCTGGSRITRTRLLAVTVGTLVPTAVVAASAAAQIPVVVDLDAETAPGDPAGEAPPAGEHPPAGEAPAPTPEPSPTPTTDAPPGTDVPLPALPPADGTPEAPTATPTVGPPPAQEPGPLPRTGADAGVLLLLAILCVALGVAAIRALPFRRTP